MTDEDAAFFNSLLLRLDAAIDERGSDQVSLPLSPAERERVARLVRGGAGDHVNGHARSLLMKLHPGDAWPSTPRSSMAEPSAPTPA
jgi:hypothetical protein